MMRKCFALVLIFLQVSGPAFASVLTVEEVSVIGAAADDYYTGSKTKLKVLEGGKVGRTLITSAELSATNALSGLAMGAAGIAGIAYYERTGQDPVYAAANAVASAADALFVPAYQAFRANFVSPESYPASAAQYVGTEGSVGGKIGDIADFAKAHESTFPNFSDLMASHTSESSLAQIPLADVNNPPVGSYWLAYNSSVYQSTYTLPTWSYLGWNKTGKTLTGVSNYVGGAAAPDSSEIGTAYVAATGFNKIALVKLVYNAVGGGWKFYATNIVLTTQLEPTYLPIPGLLNFDDLKDDLTSPSPEIKEEVKEIVKNLPQDQKITSPDPAPQTVPAAQPSPITNPQIQNFFITNTTNVHDKNAETIANGGDAVLGTAITELTEAQEDEVTKQTGETYSPISANPFGTAYNPGPYDIPTRFTTFLANVKTSGLFSFSSNFFNSLPGGGSPVYQIHGGSTFGNHTIDLSDTMSTGLAILKSILLVCFGFLSIRAIIMKR